MEDCVDFVLLQAVHNLGGVRDVALVEGKVLLVVENAGVIEGGAVVKLVERYDIVRVGVGQGKMSYQPTSTVTIRRAQCNVGAGRGVLT